ncbi:hypothetical protein J7T55_012330 [Diaporthe amygdali]|uniref:uncharacterized protein n=1 Tax=Phomopsis amygdali TaxID=1214568 RepID=UPI0022FE6A07|nr:uncharacterized protein J7T55_012330 [Diaporthe amygdali]KAJ0123859.1 hypothetical protein J7T55_012330 [Diaporthe amygdali]
MRPALCLLLVSQTLYSTTVAIQNTYDLQIGYMATIVPGLPDPLGGPGCGLWAEITLVGDSPEVAVMDGKSPSDGCPAADMALFCGRWGCPFTMTFEQVVHMTVLADNGDDKSMTVRAAALEAGEVDVDIIP